jgi:hypothetical protein
MWTLSFPNSTGSVMIEKFARAGSKVGSESLDLDHATDSTIDFTSLASLMIPQLAHEADVEHRRASESRR